MRGASTCVNVLLLWLVVFTRGKCDIGQFQGPEKSLRYEQTTLVPVRRAACSATTVWEATECSSSKKQNNFKITLMSNP